MNLNIEELSDFYDYLDNALDYQKAITQELTKKNNRNRSIGLSRRISAKLNKIEKRINLLKQQSQKYLDITS